MDLSFPKNAVSYLQKLVSQVNTREETMDVTIPDQEPDIDRVISSWAIPVIRSRELHSGSMSASGGIQVWVLYVPTDETGPKTVSAYLPFNMKWDIPAAEQETFMRINCQMHSVDARMVGARKLLIRAVVACLGEVFTRGEAQFYSLPTPPDDLEILRRHLPLLLPAEIAEKEFQLEEPVDIPAGIPPVESIVAYQIKPMITDSKVLGEKAVFKGQCRLHLVYMTPEQRLAVWDFEVPFSQYTDLVRNFDEEQELQCQPVITSSELEPESDGLFLKCGLCVQCTVLEKQSVEMVTDLYSLRRQVIPEISDVPLRTRLDHQTIQQNAAVSFPIRGSTMVDSTFLPAFPKVNRTGATAVIDAGVWCGIIYYDESGALQGRQGRSNTLYEMPLADGCPCQAVIGSVGPVQWSNENGGTTAKAALELTVDSFSEETMNVVSGAALGNDLTLDADRASLVIQAPKSDDTLWSIAKRNGSTVEAIRKANGLKSGPLEENKLLLIPIL